jgi:hypothetical protein
MLKAASPLPFFSILFHGASMLGTLFQPRERISPKPPGDTNSVPKLMKPTLFLMTSASILQCVFRNQP